MNTERFDLLSVDEAINFLGICRQRFYALREAGVIPMPMRHGSRLVYHKSILEKLIEVLGLQHKDGGRNSVLTSREAEAYLGISRQAMSNWRAAGLLKEPFKHKGKAFYLLDDLDAALVKRGELAHTNGKDRLYIRKRKNKHVFSVTVRPSGCSIRFRLTPKGFTRPVFAKIDDNKKSIRLEPKHGVFPEEVSNFLANLQDEDTCIEYVRAEGTFGYDCLIIREGYPGFNDIVSAMTN